MPKAVPVTYERFLLLEKGLTTVMGFSEVRRPEPPTVIRVPNLALSRINPEAEIIYRYSAPNGLVVKVCTSCLRAAVEECRAHPLFLHETVSRAPGTDYGWVLIEDPSGKVQYFAKPSMRTENFERTFLRRIWITQYKVNHPPSCRQCGAMMDICENADGGNYWGCFRNHLHEGGRYESMRWHDVLPPRAKSIAEAWNREYKEWRSGAKKETGKYPRQARAIRAGVVAGRSA